MNYKEILESIKGELSFYCKENENPNELFEKLILTNSLKLNDNIVNEFIDDFYKTTKDKKSCYVKYFIEINDKKDYDNILFQTKMNNNINELVENFNNIADFITKDCVIWVMKQEFENEEDNCGGDILFESKLVFDIKQNKYVLEEQILELFCQHNIGEE